MAPATKSKHSDGHRHDDACCCGESHSHVQIKLVQTLLGMVLVINSFLVKWLFESGEAVAAASAFLGSIVLGFPIIWTAVKSVRIRVLNTNALVALAILALVGSEHYQEAGLVSFFMLMGQVIEARTAEGAMTSIKSLIQLTPKKARRIADQEVPDTNFNPILTL